MAGSALRCPRRVLLTALLIVSACGGLTYDEYRVSDAWGNQETVMVPQGKTVAEISSFAHLADLLGGSALSTGDRACLMINYNGPMLVGSSDEPSVVARRALETCGFPVLAGED